MDKINEMLKINSYKIVESNPKDGEVNLKVGVNLGCPILECSKNDRDELQGLLKGIGFRMMVREKSDNVIQFILRK